MAQFMQVSKDSRREFRFCSLYIGKPLGEWKV